MTLTALTGPLLAEPTADLSEQAVASASAAFRTLTRRYITTATDTVNLNPEGDRVLFLPDYPVTLISAITEEGATVSSDDVEVSMDDGLIRKRSGACWSRRFAGVVVTYTHGYAEVPWDVVECVTQMATRLQNQAGGEIRQETIGSYSYTLANVGLTSYESDIIAAYTRPVRP